MKPHIWYSEYHDSWFVGSKSKNTPTSRHASIMDMSKDWDETAAWFERVMERERGVKIKFPKVAWVL